MTIDHPYKIDIQDGQKITLDPEHDAAFIYIGASGEQEEEAFVDWKFEKKVEEKKWW